MGDFGSQAPDGFTTTSRIRHVAMFTFTDGVTESQIDALDEALRSLPGLVDEIEAFTCGRDLRLADGTWDYVVVADFASIDAYASYASHADHVAILDESVKPLVAGIQRVQFALP